MLAKRRLSLVRENLVFTDMMIKDHILHEESCFYVTLEFPDVSRSSTCGHLTYRLLGTVTYKHTTKGDENGF
jgi:hypothetical protein